MGGFLLRFKSSRVGLGGRCGADGGRSGQRQVSVAVSVAGGESIAGTASKLVPAPALTPSSPASSRASMVHAGLKCLAPGVNAAVDDRDNAPSFDIQLIHLSSDTFPAALHGTVSVPSTVSLTEAVSP